jgi:hypothetical protein
MPDLRPLLGSIVTTPGHRHRLRLVRLGWLWCLVCQITTGGFPMPQPLVPEPWPEMPIGRIRDCRHQESLSGRYK